MTEEFHNKNRAYRLPGRNLPDTTREKLRQRSYRSRVSSLSRAIGPIKVLGFAMLFISLVYLSIVQLKHLFFQTSYFELKKIQVTGNAILDTEEIIKTSGASPGMNVFLLDKGKILKNVTAHPQIESAKVDLQGLYNLNILVEERVPVMYAKVGTAFYEISQDGTILSTENLGDKELPIITGLSLTSSRAGDSLKGNDGFFIAKNWVSSLEKSVLQNISEINFSNHQNPYLYLTSGVKIYPRSLEDFKKRFTFLRALLDNLRENNVEPIYLDMRAPSIVVRPQKTTGASEGSRGSVAGG